MSLSTMFDLYTTCVCKAWSLSQQQPRLPVSKEYRLQDKW